MSTSEKGKDPRLDMTAAKSGPTAHDVSATTGTGRHTRGVLALGKKFTDGGPAKRGPSVSGSPEKAERSAK